MKSDEELFKAADAYVRGLSTGPDEESAISYSYDFGEGIYHRFQSKRFLETGDERYMRIGLLHFIVDRSTGDVFRPPDSAGLKEGAIRLFLEGKN